MADLFEIGKSGVQSYRRALGVTGQNIANANTEGYNRRDAQLAEVSATQGDILSVSDQAGLGVRVENIRRAFDDLIVAKTNTANSSFENARAANEKLQSIERILLPGDYSISSYLQNFFDGLNAVHQAPTDLGARQLVIEYGELLADGVVSLANGLANLKNELRTEASSVAEMVNVTVSGLLDVQKKLISSGGSGAASNSLLDQRDLLIQELSGYVGISTLYGERGAVNISLGPNNGKEKLLDLFDTQQLVIDDTKSELGYALLKGSAVSATTQVTNGYLAGLSKASDAIDETLKQLDHLTQKLIQDFNDIHRNGLTLNEDQGRDLFSVGTHDIFIEPNNTQKFDVFVSNGELNVTRELVYVEKSGSFVDISNGDTFDLLNNQITIDEGVLQFSDLPHDGDTIYLQPSDNISKSLKFVIEHPQDIAASSSFEINKNLDNVGVGSLSATKKTAENSTNLVEISDIFNNDLNPVTAQSFRSNVTALTIPPEVNEIEFLVTEKQASARLVLSESEIALLRSKTLSFDGVNFSLSATNPDNLNNLEELVVGLNGGTIRSDKNEALSDLGLIAATNGSTLSFTQKRNINTPFTTVNLGKDRADFLPLNPVNSEGSVYVFSRDGRQISGPALDETQIEEFLSSKNGFFEDAEYRADYLNTNFLGSSVEENGVDLSYQFTFPASGDWSSNSSQRFFSELGISSSLNRQGFDIWIGETASDTAPQVISIDPGLMAADVKKSIDTVLSKFGISTSVSNKIKASLSTGGKYPSAVSFGLKNKDGTYSDINVGLLSNDLTELVNQINLVSEKTGVVAQISNTSSAFTLEHVSGDEIVFSDFEINGSSASDKEFLHLQKLYSDGAIIENASAKLFSGKSLRVSGEVDLQSSSGFAASIAPYAAQNIPVLKDARVSKHSSFITENLSMAGDIALVNFDFAADLFENSTNNFSATGYVADANLTFKINETTTGLNVADLSDKSSFGIASELVKDYRSQSQISLSADLEFEGPNFNTAETVEFEFEGKQYAVEVTLPNSELEKVITFTSNNSEKIIPNPFDFQTKGATLQYPSTVTEDTINFKFNGEDYSVQIKFSNDQISWLGNEPQLFEASLKQTDHGYEVTVMATERVPSADLGKAKIAWSDNTNDRFSVSLQPIPTGYKLSLGSNDGVPTAEIINFTSSHGAARIDQRLHYLRKGFEQDVDVTNADLLEKFQKDFSSSTRAMVSESGLELYDLNGEHILTESTLDSSIISHTKLTNLPSEELIVLFDNASTSNFSVKYSSSPKLEPENRDLIIKSIDSELGIVEILDAATRQSLATRVMDAEGRFSALGFDFELGGSTVTGDEFEVLHAMGGDANSDNLLNLLALSDYNSETGTGEFNQIFKQMVAELGMEVKSSQITRDAAENAKQSILELKDEFSGINLDTEAANLMEQQQAYQALARVLSTARDLLNTLMEVI